MLFPWMISFTPSMWYLYSLIALCDNLRISPMSVRPPSSSDFRVSERRSKVVESSTSMRTNLSRIKLRLASSSACSLVLGNPSMIQLFFSFSNSSIYFITSSMAISSSTYWCLFLESWILWPRGVFLLISRLRRSPTETDSCWKWSERARACSFLLLPGGPMMTMRLTFYMGSPSSPILSRMNLTGSWGSSMINSFIMDSKMSYTLFVSI